MNSGYTPRAHYKGDLSPYSRLLTDVCVGHGFCGHVRDGVPMHVDQLIPSSGYLTAHQFAMLVLLADGNNPFEPSKPDPNRVFSTEYSWAMAWIADAFEHHFGRTTVHVSAFDIDDEPAEAVADNPKKD